MINQFSPRESSLQTNPKGDSNLKRNHSLIPTPFHQHRIESQSQVTSSDYNEKSNKAATYFLTSQGRSPDTDVHNQTIQVPKD